MVGPGAEVADDQEQRAHDDVEAVEAGRQEADRGVDAAAPELEGCVGVFDRLEAGEAQAEQDGDAESVDEGFLVAFQQAVMRPGDRAAGEQQDHRIQQRQMERVEREDVRRRPDQHPVALGFRVEQEVEIGPEEAREEHHLGPDEQHHAVAQAQANDRRMRTGGAGFLDDVAPPHEGGAECQQRAGDQHEVAMVVRGQDDAEHNKEAAQRGDDRPRAGVGQMVGVLHT